MKQSSPFKIGFDAKRAARNNTGLGNYSRFIITLLTKYSPQNRYYLYTPTSRRPHLLSQVADHTNVCYPHTSFWRRCQSLWRIWGVTRAIAQQRIDLFHGLSNELPLNIRQAKHTRSIVTIHDLIFMRYPRYYRFFDRMIYRYKFRKACRNADRIIAVSHCTKRDIIDYWGIPSDKIDVVYQGCANNFKRPVSEKQLQSVREKYELPEQFILYVGSIEERKNLLLAVRALRRLNRPVKLVAIGKRTAYTQRVEQYISTHQMENSVTLLTGISTQELPAFYRLATVFVYPSFFEGFGIPILEALCCGTPVIAAKGSCLEEAGGPSSLYVDPNNPDELAQALERVLDDPHLRHRMIDEGLTHAHRFDDEQLFRNLYDVYEKTLHPSVP